MKKTAPEFVYEVRWFDQKTDSYKYTETPRTRPHYSSMSQPRQILNKWFAKKQEWDEMVAKGFPDYMKRETRRPVVGDDGKLMRGDNGSFVYENKVYTDKELRDITINPWFRSLSQYPKIFKLTMGVIKEEEVD